MDYGPVYAVSLLPCLFESVFTRLLAWLLFSPEMNYSLVYGLIWYLGCHFPEYVKSR
jgi:hypothetical protein